MDTVLIGLIPIAFVVVFVVFWQTIVWLIGQIGGWRGLAQHFATDRQLTGDSFGWKTVWIGWLGSYRSSVNIIVSYEGVYLRPIFFFRAGHPPLLIPWEAVTSIEETDMSIFSSTRLEIQSLKGDFSQRITIYGKSVNASIQRHAPIHLSHKDKFA